MAFSDPNHRRLLDDANKLFGKLSKADRNHFLAVAWRLAARLPFPQVRGVANYGLPVTELLELPNPAPYFNFPRLTIQSPTANYCELPPYVCGQSLNLTSLN